MSKGKTIIALVCLISLWLALCAHGQPVAPHLLSPPSTPSYNYYYFAATCTDTKGLESDYSNEVCLETTNCPPLTVALAWDKSPGTNVITNYTIYEGPDTRTYTQQVNVGLCLTGSVTIHPRIWKTILVFACSNAPGLSLTNLEDNLFVRAHAWQAKNQRWPTVLQGAYDPSGPWSDLTGIITNATKPTLVMRVRRWRE